MKKYILLSLLPLALFSSCGPQNQEEVKTEQITPSATCSYVRDETDSLGKRVRALEKEIFMVLDFTDTATKSYFKGAEFFRGYLGCASVDTNFEIHFDFKVLSDNAYQYYGMIKKNNKITFILKSGKAVELLFGNTFSGNTDLSSESTEYSAFAYLPRNVVQKLKSEELKRVRISWTKMDEDYTVVNPEIFIKQLSCLE